MVRKTILHALWLLGAPVLAHASLYTVGSGVGCSHSTLQGAVDAAALHAGADEIHLTMPVGGFTAQAVTIESQPLVVIGGFANCNATVPTGHTRLSGAGAPSAAVVSVVGRRAAANVRLERLELVDGDNTAGSGGGLHFATSGVVAIANSLIAGNDANAGGGIGVEGPAGAAKTRLRIGDNVVVRDNRAFYGGGIHVFQAALEIEGMRTGVRGNTAVYSGGDSGRGGGIAVIGTSAALSASADIGSGGDERVGNLVGNVARRGAGLYVDGHASARLFMTDLKRAPRVEWNVAQEYGGGIYAHRAPATVEVWDGAIGHNHAEFGGGALYAEDGAVMKIRSARDGSAPATAVPCLGARPCSRIFGNESMNGAIPKTAAVVLVMNRERDSDSHVEIDAAAISDNVGASLFGDNCEVDTPAADCSAPMTIALTNSLVAPNADAGTVATIRRGARFMCAWCTVADVHGSLTPEASQGLFETNGLLQLHGTIVWEPLRNLLGTQGPAALLVHDVIVHDAGALPSRPDIRSDDPLFAAPAAGDYRLSPSSPALDSAPAPPTAWLDLDGAARVTDLPGVIDLAGPTDLGAYERDGP